MFLRCEAHQDKDAVGFCAECGRGICEECAVEFKNMQYCTECANKISPEESRFHDIADKVEEEKVLELSDRFIEFLIELNNKIDWKSVFIATSLVVLLSFVCGVLVSNDYNLMYFMFRILEAGYGSVTLALLSGLIAGYVSGRVFRKGKNLMSGAFNGAISSLIATTFGIIMFIWVTGLLHNGTVLETLMVSAGFFYTYILSLTYIFVIILFGLIGGFAGTLIKLQQDK